MKEPMRKRKAAPFLSALVIASASVAAATPTPEDLVTARAVFLAHQAIGGLHSAAGGCPTSGRGVVDVAALFAEAKQPAPEGATVDGWGRALLAWCDGAQWAVISKGADGLLSDACAAMPPAGPCGDDFAMLDEQRVFLPPNVQQAMEAGRQKRTMADMRSVAMVFEAYRVDNNALPGGPTTGFVPVETIRGAVQPVYIRELPVQDAWGQPIWIWSDGMHYRIVSAGKDGEMDADYATTPGSGATTSVDSDIVIADGQFTQQPA